MPLVARVTFVVLVVATFAAFFVAQRLKSEPPVINVPQITQYFSPNGDGEARTSADIAFYIKVADEATVDVVNLDGDRVRRLADARADAAEHARCAWAGTARPTTGRVVPDGQYRLRVSLRDEGRSAIVQKTMRVDTKAPQPQVCIGVPVREAETAGATSSPRATARSTDLRPAASPRFATQLPRLPHRPGQAAAGRAASSAAAGAPLRWDGLVDGKPLDPGRLPRPGAGARPGRQRRRSRPREFEPGARCRGRPGLTVRGIAAQPPLRPVTAGGRTEFFVDARGARVPLARAARRRQGRSSSAARRPTRTSSSARPRARPASTCSSCAPAAGTRPCRSSCRPRSARACSWSCPTITWLGTDKVDDTPFDGLPNTLADRRTRCAGRACSSGDERAAGRLRGRRRAAARLPRPPQDPLRPHQ